MKRFIRSASVALGLLFAGCQNYEVLHEKELTDAGFTQAQAEVGAAVGLRNCATDEVDQEDGTRTYELNYGCITNEHVLSFVQRTYADLDDMLEFDGNMENVRFFLNTPFGKHLLKQTVVFKYHNDKLLEHKMHRDFKKLINGRGVYSRYNPLDVSDDDKYSLADSFPFDEGLEFDADYVKAAREAGKLGDPANIVELDVNQYTYFEEVPNPDFHFDKGEKEFVFKRRHMGHKMVAYNLDNDEDMEADYVEVFRLKEDGLPENRPAIRIFKPNGVGSLEVVVADREFEGEPGHGVVDLVQSGYLGSGSDILASNVMDHIFQDMGKGESRQLPDISRINKLYLARAGTMQMQEYDINEDGWEQFLPQYKVPHHGDVKFRVHIRLAKPQVESEKHKARSIEWIALQYGGGSRVVEFYKPEGKFDGKYKVTVKGRRVSVLDEDGRFEDYDVKALTPDKPYRIDFDRNKKRWEIRDRDGDGEHYEAKREIAKPDDVIPKE